MKHITHSSWHTALFGGALPLSLALGCAPSQPPKGLVDARQAVQVAERGQAAKFAPDELLEARTLLADAERASAHSDKQIHLAYLADRQARAAEAEGKLEMNKARLDAAEERYLDTQDARRTSAEEGLEETQRELADTRKDQRQKLSAQGAALTEAQRARAAAEERARAAIASLNELAQVKEEANETTITLSGAVLFKTGESELLPLARNTLDRVATALKQLDGSQTVVINGHTDSRGADDMNRRLSQARADAVRTYLVSQGVKANRLTAVGQGDSQPLATNDSAEGRANNRRVEMVIAKASSGSNEAER